MPELALRQGEILTDYRLACRSRQVSLVGRREVMGGKAKFGIFGDGKELAQIAMAKAFRQGDYRSLRHAQPEPGWQLEEPGRDVQLLGRCLPDRIADAQAGWAGLRIPSI